METGRMSSTMTTRTALDARRRRKLLGGASALVLGLVVAAAPANAQVARLRSVFGGTAVATGTNRPPVTTTVRSQSMRDALAAQQANRATIQSLRTLVTQARSAAIAATRAIPTDGLSAKGLDPAVSKLRAAVDDPTGLATWQGALLPTQTESGGKYNVTIKQTDARALLSWNRFDVGANTTLTFDQKVGGVAQTDWVVLNRVVDPKASPTTILGHIKADGTVLVINRNGVIFGSGAQVNTNSLLVSSLEIGNIAKVASATSDTFTALSIADRNTGYLNNGLLQASPAPGRMAASLTSSVAGSGTYSIFNVGSSLTSDVEGGVTIDRGASLTAGSGGYVIVTAPNIANDGTITADQGQVSLQAGRVIGFGVSTGGNSGLDPDIRGFLLRTMVNTGGTVVNSGLVEAKRGYVSLGADLLGTVTNAGLVTATTSVSRNGTISLTAGTINLVGTEANGFASGVAILDDASPETVPQGTADAPPSFRQSRIDIGGLYVTPTATANDAGLLGPAAINFGNGSLLLAPGATVSIGGRAGGYDQAALLAGGGTISQGSITVGADAIIDVSGIKDVQLAASRNAVTISPLKGNELRDTPNYRDVKTDGSFTLNGKTVTVDIRKSGVRADGVAWVGSPLIEAGSAISQIGVGAAELMTKGGSVTFGVDLPLDASNPAAAPRVTIAKSATVDFSGGWTHYNTGVINTTKLIRADGTLVDIANADPNGDYIGLADGNTAVQSKFGTSQTFASPLISGIQPEPAYDEGRDAGALVIRAAAASLDGRIDGKAYSGFFQLQRGAVGTASASLSGDTRTLQATAYELPSGGYLRIGSFAGSGTPFLGGNIVVDHGAAPVADGITRLTDSQLSQAGLGALRIETSGGVSFAADSDIVLANGGRLTVNAGRTVHFDGTITARSGSISATTAELLGAVQTSPVAAAGSLFDPGDDVKASYAADETPPSPFDVVVSGKLDVAGLWSNDFLSLGGLPSGTAYTSGGSISLAVAPKVLVVQGTNPDTATLAVDLSGSIRLRSSALLDVSSGGHVTSDGLLDLVAKGGNISLINDTVYASLTRTDPTLTEGSSTDQAINGQNQSVSFTTIVGDLGKRIVVSLVPVTQRATVEFTADNFKGFGFGFGGGGVFKLVAPQIALSDTAPAAGSWLKLDFIQSTGFGTLDLSAWHSRVFSDLFAGGVHGNSAFLDTTSFVIHDGETLDLTQALLPVYSDHATTAKLVGLETGADVTSVVSAAVPTAAWDQRAASLKLGGLTELVVEQGGSITGAAGASIQTPGLLNAGTIRLVGGTIRQLARLPDEFLADTVAVRSLDDVLGGRVVTDGAVQYREDALSKIGTLTNGQLFSKPAADKTVYFLGQLDAGEALKLAPGSVTDLSGAAVFDPRAALLAGNRIRSTGRLYDGGSISTANGQSDTSTRLFESARYEINDSGAATPIGVVTIARAIDAQTGAKIDLSGAAATFDELLQVGSYTPTRAWSNGGTLSILGGGSLGGAAIVAKGGSAAAFGGTLEWLDPILRQSTDSTTEGNSVLSADQIMDAGFSTMIARGGIGIEGGTRLSLGKAFLVQSATPTSASPSETDFRVTISLLSDGNGRIEAPYINIGSQAQTFSVNTPTSASQGSLTFAAKSIDLVGAVGFVVPAGVTADGAAAGAVNLLSGNDIRFIGTDRAVADPTRPTGLTGGVVSTGDLSFVADQVYAATGTGNLQQLLEDRRNGTKVSSATPYLVASLADAGTVRFASNGDAAPASPYSAGSWLRVVGANIVQDGVLRAPLGLLELGSQSAVNLPGSLIAIPASQSISFGAGSVTSVSGAGLNVPYGQTTDGSEYYFSPNVNSALTAAPVGQLTLAGRSIDVKTGATLDGQGGGDIFAFEFVSGTGGSRDVLSRFNADTFSSNGGLAYADGRQVYAALPVAQAGLVASFDPLYSADYKSGGDSLYGLAAGRTVWLDAAPGIAAGEYLLLPAHYAFLPGATRLVENTDAAAPLIGGGNAQLDGSVIVGGSYGTAGTDFRESARRSFTLMAAAAFNRYSKLNLTSGTIAFDKLAAAQGKAAPRSPLDAARFVFNPTLSLTVDGIVKSAAAPGGRGAQFDIAASAIEIRAAAGPLTENVLTLTADTLANLNANSLFIGGVREENVDGTTTLKVTARNIEIDSGVSLTAPELVLAVGGSGSRLVVDAGASLSATGTLADKTSADYRVGFGSSAAGYDQTGIGSVLRLASGPERLVARTVDPELSAPDLARTQLQVLGGASLAGNAVAFNTSGAVSFADDANIAATSISLGAATISFGEGGLAPAFAQKLAAATNLTLSSRGVVFLGAGLPSAFNNLTLDAQGIASDGSDLTINAKSFTLRNSKTDRGGCSVAGMADCGSSAKLAVVADQVTLGDGTFRIYGFGGGVTLDAAKGIAVTGKGSLAIDDPANPGFVGLTLKTPFIADHARGTAAEVSTVGADYTFSTRGAVIIDGSGRTGTPDAKALAIGSTIAFGGIDDPVASFALNNAAIRATAGIIDVHASGNITASGTANIAAPGYTTNIGTGDSAKVVTAGSGSITLQSDGGNIALAKTATLVVDNGIGSSGNLNLAAARGTITLGAAINPAIAAGATRQASILLDGASLLDATGAAFSLAGFVKDYGRLFGGTVQIRTGSGNLALDAGQTLKAESVKLVTDSGRIDILGRIDTSGDDVSKLKMTDAAYTSARVDGGDISLFGGSGIALGATGALIARTGGYAAGDSRQAKGGNVMIGVSSDAAKIDIAGGALIDVSASKTADRFVTMAVKDPQTLILTSAFRKVAGDVGGLVTFRAPLLNGNVVDLSANGTITGASALTLDAFRRFDLDQIAQAGAYSGITRDADGTVHLDAAATGLPNFLADTAAGTLPDFVRNFTVARKDRGSLAGYRLRPEVEISAAGMIVLDSNLNLGAGKVVDYAAAVADGLLTVSPLGPDAGGKPRYEVVAGKEAELFARYVDMTYRVGGKVTGEAGVFTIRAGGDLKVANSISDGFFSFHDKTDPKYLSYQLGGGDRSYGAAVSLDCALGSVCDDTLRSYSKFGTRLLDDGQIVVIDLSLPELGAQNSPLFVHSPFSATANSVAANGTGNAIGTGELFPLVDGRSVASSDINLVAGAAAGSADPLAIYRSSRGSVIVAGEKFYKVVAKQGVTRIGGTAQLGFDDGSGTYVYTGADKFFDGQFAGYVDPETAKDLYTRLNWGSDTDLADATRAAALRFFAGHRFIKEDGVVIGVVASLDQVAQFLSGDYGQTFTKLAKPDLDLSVIDAPIAFDQPRSYYNPLVRTGTGGISVAAAGNVSLVGSTTITYRANDGTIRDESGVYGNTDFTAQVGGSAIYTAGARLSLGGIAETYQAEKLGYVPSIQGLLDAAPVVAGGGGAISLVAGRDVLGRRDIWSEAFRSSAISIDTTLPGYDDLATTFDGTRIGSADQQWRVGEVGQSTKIAIVPQLFSSGVGALAGGNVTVSAGRDVSDLVIALDNSALTDKTPAGQKVILTSGGGNLSLDAGRNLLGGQIDVAQGIARVAVGAAVVSAGDTLAPGSYDGRVNNASTANLLRLRVNDATIALTARGAVDIAGIGALGAQPGTLATADQTLNAAGFFSPIAGVSIATPDRLAIVGNRADQRVVFATQATSLDVSTFLTGYVLPPSLSLTSIASDIAIGNGNANLLYASPYGQLSITAGGNLANFALSMSDADPSDLPGLFSVSRFIIEGGNYFRDQGLGYVFGGVVQPTSDATLRLLHNRAITHRDDPNPVEIYAGGSISKVQLVLPKAAQVNAGGDIVDFNFEGQNLQATDITRIVAGGDITATTALPSLDNPVVGRPYVNATSFTLGGPGALMIEAGGNLGPFLNSATVANVSYAGGIRTVGNENNPWLGQSGASIYALFGVAKRADFSALDATYLDPANTSRLDGDLFVQNVDTAGNRTPDRAKPVYAPKLAAWLRDNAPEVFAKVFPDAAGASDSALAALAYTRYSDMYAAYKQNVPELQQRRFLMQVLYFGELGAVADPNGPSYQQYVRGYRAIQTLFPVSAGYTDNLSTFTTDPATVSADHPLGEPAKTLDNGEPAKATRVLTGNVDLRLATIQTARGGSVTILGPGGDFIAGSVVRTSEQAARKSTLFTGSGVSFMREGYANLPFPGRIDSIPIGFEGVLTLRGGAIQSFTDGDFRLNQSRLFTLSGGDVAMWSSNGDLNAGQGPKTSSNFPPITLRFTPDAFSEVDSAGSVSGAGIGALRPSADVAASSVTLIAPVGTVDAGDAGVRASGDVFVAAARVANADNFKVGGASVGVPTTAVVAAPAAPPGATAAVAATAAQARAQEKGSADRESVIRVDVLGFIGGNSEDCASGRFDSSGKCVR